MSQEKIEQLEKEQRELRLKHREVVAFCYAHIKALKQIQDLCALFKAGETGINGNEEQVVTDIKRIVTDVLVSGSKTVMAEYDAQQKANELASKLAEVNRKGGFNRHLVDELLALLGASLSVSEEERKKHGHGRSSQ